MNSDDNRPALQKSLIALSIQEGHTGLMEIQSVLTMLELRQDMIDNLKRRLADYTQKGT